MARRPDFRSIRRRLLEPPVGHFTEDEIDGLPAAVRRYFRASIAEGTPLYRTATISMRGRIRIGRWLPFRAREVLNPQRGFIWRARTAVVISGSDHYVDGNGAMRWKLAGVATVAEGAGPDVARSAAGRVAGEAIWLPTALLPRFGVDWEADDSRITAHYELDGNSFDLVFDLEPDGKPSSITFQRWGDPDGEGTSATHGFGGDFTDYATYAGLTVPTRGSVGWHHGTSAWDGGFFRFRIVRLEPFSS